MKSSFTSTPRPGTGIVDRAHHVKRSGHVDAHAGMAVAEAAMNSLHVMRPI